MENEERNVAVKWVKTEIKREDVREAYDKLYDIHCKWHVVSLMENAEQIFENLDWLKKRGYTVAEIEEMCGIQLKRDHVCIFDLRYKEEK